MAWKIKWDQLTEKDLKKIDKLFAKKITQYMQQRVASLDNPRTLDKGLQYEKYGRWRYGVEDYRILCKIHDHNIEILVIRVVHRKDVYDE